MRKFAVVTTCHADGYARYGREMVRTFLEQWPQDVPLLLYTEGFRLDGTDARVIERDLESASPALVAFKRRHANDPRACGMVKPGPYLTTVGATAVRIPWFRRRGTYRHDAVRFSHKMFAIFHAARQASTDVLIWIDADTRFFAPVDHAELEVLAPAHAAVSCLLRPSHTECGFVAYNLRDPATATFLADFERFYTEDLFFAEREYHDSWLFDVARRRAQQRGMSVHDIGGGIGRLGEHVLINSRLGAFMDHMKGNRKEAGRSRNADLLVPRTEAYWTEP